MWLSAFQNDIDNLVEYVVTDFTTFEGSNQNVARARIRGLEAGYEIRQESWRMRLEAISQDPEDRDSGEKLLRRASQSLTASAVRSLGRLEAGMDVLATGARKDFGFPEAVELPGYALVNLSLRYALTDSWSLQGKIENALDREYQTADTYTMAGRGIYVSVNYRAL
jgi:vitamin B12 transporter